MHRRAGIPVWGVMMLLVLLSACSGAGRVRYATPEEAFNKGKEQFDRGRYMRAIEYFQGTFNFGRAHEWADDAQLYLARAYAANGDYILAANEFSRFAQIYRGDERVPEAEYERAMTYYALSPAYALDQTDTEEAIRQFDLFIRRYSDSDKVEEATTRIRELREKLAHKQYMVGAMYERQESYQAAALSYEDVFDMYPSSGWSDDALLAAMRIYIRYSEESIEARQAERLQKAIDVYERMIQVFPDSPLLKEAEALYDLADARISGLIAGPAQAAANTPNEQ